jgi:ABC-type methionine transport system ATPase subunit
MHTAQHIVEYCLKGDLMRDRTVILVTHHIKMCLPIASFLVELGDGQVKRSGTISELQATKQLPASAFESDDDEEIRPEATSPVENEADAIDASVMASNSVNQPQPAMQKSLVARGKLIEAEARAEGRVSVYTYLTYIRAAGWISWVFTLILMLLIRLFSIANDVRGPAHFMDCDT